MNRDIILTQLPMAMAVIKDLAEYAENAGYDFATSMMEAANELLTKAYDDVGTMQSMTYYHVEFNDSYDDVNGYNHEFLNSTVITVRQLPLYANSNLVSIEQISKEEYDKYMEDYNDDCK